MRKKILPQEVLKLIACITMLIDHLGVSVVINLAIPGVVPLYYTCRVIGRIAFPIYCFLLVEGMRRTRSTGKYILRLCIGALLSELPFDLLLKGAFNWGYQSVMVTLTLGALMLLCMQKTEKTWLQLILVLPFAILAEVCKCDYGGWGIAMIAVFALFDQIPLQFVAMLLVCYLMPSGMIPIFGVSVSYELAALVAVLPIAQYSGRKLTHNKVIQWGFYLFYPVHLLILWVILRCMA